MNATFVTEPQCSSATQTISRTLKRKKLQKWNGPNTICNEVFIDKSDKLRAGSKGKKKNSWNITQMQSHGIPQILFNTATQKYA